MKKKSGFLSIVSRAAHNFSNDQAMTSAAALAFYSALSLAPLVLFFVSVGGFISEKTEDTIIAQFNDLVGPQGAETISMIVNNAQKDTESGILGSIVSILILLFSASAVFAEFQGVLNRIFHAPPIERGAVTSWLRKRVFSAGMLLAIGFFMVVSLIVSTVLQVFSFSSEGIFWEILNSVISIGIFSLFFAAVYKFLPDIPLAWRQVWLGALFTGIFFSLGKAGIGLYLGNSAIGSAYGAAGSLIVLLVWVYYSSLIILFGAELTRILALGDKTELAGATGQPARPQTTAA